MSYSIEQIIEKLRQTRIVPVITLDKSEDILPLTDILIQNGLPIIEITFRSVTAEQAISLARQHFPDVLVAAGTILSTKQVISAKNAGADFIVTPGFNAKIVQFCQQLNLPITPGVNNPMAVEAALEMGINTVKFFPAQASGGVQMIKALLGPYEQLQIMPTGGIGLDNIRTYLDIPNVIACGGSWFVDKSLIRSKNWNEIGRLTREIMALIHS